MIYSVNFVYLFVVLSLVHVTDTYNTEDRIKRGYGVASQGIFVDYYRHTPLANAPSIPPYDARLHHHKSYAHLENEDYNDDDYDDDDEDGDYEDDDYDEEAGHRFGARRREEIDLVRYLQSRARLAARLVRERFNREKLQQYNLDLTTRALASKLSNYQDDLNHELLYKLEMLSRHPYHQPGLGVQDQIGPNLNHLPIHSHLPHSISLGGLINNENYQTHLHDLERMNEHLHSAEIMQQAEMNNPVSVQTDIPNQAPNIESHFPDLNHIVPEETTAAIEDPMTIADRATYSFAPSAGDISSAATKATAEHLYRKFAAMDEHLMQVVSKANSQPEAIGNENKKFETAASRTFRKFRHGRKKKHKVRSKPIITRRKNIPKKKKTHGNIQKLKLKDILKKITPNNETYNLPNEMNRKRQQNHPTTVERIVQRARVFFPDSESINNKDLSSFKDTLWKLDHIISLLINSTSNTGMKKDKTPVNTSEKKGLTNNGSTIHNSSNRSFNTHTKTAENSSNSEGITLDGTKNVESQKLKNITKNSLQEVGGIEQNPRVYGNETIVNKRLDTQTRQEKYNMYLQKFKNEIKSKAKLNAEHLSMNLRLPKGSHYNLYGKYGGKSNENSFITYKQKTRKNLHNEDSFPIDEKNDIIDSLPESGVDLLPESDVDSFPESGVDLLPESDVDSFPENGKNGSETERKNNSSEKSNNTKQATLPESVSKYETGNTTSNKNEGTASSESSAKVETNLKKTVEENSKKLLIEDLKRKYIKYKKLRKRARNESKSTFALIPEAAYSIPTLPSRKELNVNGTKEVKKTRTIQNSAPDNFKYIINSDFDTVVGQPLMSYDNKSDTHKDNVYSTKNITSANTNDVLNKTENTQKATKSDDKIPETNVTNSDVSQQKSSMDSNRNITQSEAPAPSESKIWKDSDKVNNTNSHKHSDLPKGDYTSFNDHSDDSGSGEDQPSPAVEREDDNDDLSKNFSRKEEKIIKQMNRVQPDTKTWVVELD